MVPLIQFADCVRAISATQLDFVGLGEPAVPGALADKLRTFDDVISWYGSNRPEFRDSILQVHARASFLNALPDERWQESATDFFLKQVGAKRGTTPRIFVTSQGTRNTLVIHPFSGSAKKNWPIENFRRLAREMRCTVEWTAGPEERLEEATRFSSLLDLAVWMRGAATYLGNDSGISHLAAAIGLPCVVLFGPTSPKVWSPRGEHVRIVEQEPLSGLATNKVMEVLRSVTPPQLTNT